MNYLIAHIVIESQAQCVPIKISFCKIKVIEV